MSLIELWHNSPKQIEGKQVQQIIAFAGDGKLRDGNSASSEFREFLATVPTEMLARYTSECLSTKFPDSGLALQDVINQIGQRLGFTVTNGRYRGVRSATEIGFDGLWLAPGGSTIVTEVKTTDAYRIELDTLAGYRRALIKNGTISESSSSILIVVGREDTGELEAQIRGSRHAWDIRLISADALIQLAQVKEDLEDPLILQRIHQILVPREFTRLDEIVSILFSTAEDLKQEADHSREAIESDDLDSKKFTPVAFHSACVERIGGHLQVTFVKHSRASFQTSDSRSRLICSVSREHERSGQPGYWFAFHPHQLDYLKSAPQNSFVAFGCGSANQIILVPFLVFTQWFGDLNQTSRSDRSYWHVQILQSADRFLLLLKGGKSSVDLSKYLLRG